MESSVEGELIDVVHAWDHAMVANDAEEIGTYMADDWTIIGPDGGVGDKATFLELVRSGKLTHNVMESHDLNVRVYGDAAVAIARGISGGEYQGEAFYLVERVSCVLSGKIQNRARQRIAGAACQRTCLKFRKVKLRQSAPERATGVVWQIKNISQYSSRVLSCGISGAKRTKR